MVSSQSVACTTPYDNNWSGLIVVGGAWLGPNSSLWTAANHGCSKERNMVPGQLLYGTVLCLTEWSSGNTSQYAYFGSSLELSWKSWVVRRLGYASDRCTTHSEPLSGICLEDIKSSRPIFNNTKNQPSPWHESKNKASPSTVFLRTVTTYRVAKFCIDFKKINNIYILIHMFLYSNISSLYLNQKIRWFN